MNTQYVKEINGYMIKDEEAREEIDTLQESIFLDNVTVTKEHDNTSNTDYYITEIPYQDSKGNQNVFNIGLPYDDLTLSSSESPIDFAISKGASVCINGGIGSSLNVKKPHGILIQNGVILKDETYTIISGCEVLGIKADGSFMTFPADTTIAQEVLNAGCINALVGWASIIKNGVAVTYTPGNGVETHPRQVIARKINGDYLIFTCDGREENNVGMTIDDVQRILLARGDIDFAYNLDGGGSTSTVVELQKINENIDEHYKDREVYTFLYMIKNTNEKKDIENIYSLISKLRQELIEKTVNPEVESGILKLFSDIAEPIIKFYQQGNRSVYNGFLRINNQGLTIKYKENVEDDDIQLLTATSQFLRYLGVPFGNFMNYCTNNPSETDLNDISKEGFYICGSSTLNRPRSGTYIILHINKDSNYNVKYQYALPIHDNYIYSRSFSNNTWSAWEPCGITSGNTNGRPTAGLIRGQQYFDITLGKPIWYDGSNWVDATGTQV